MPLCHQWQSWACSRHMQAREKQVNHRLWLSTYRSTKVTNANIPCASAVGSCFFPERPQEATAYYAEGAARSRILSSPPQQLCRKETLPAPAAGPAAAAPPALRKDDGQSAAGDRLRLARAGPPKTCSRTPGASPRTLHCCNAPARRPSASGVLAWPSRPRVGHAPRRGRSTSMRTASSRATRRAIKRGRARARADGRTAHHGQSYTYVARIMGRQFAPRRLLL